MANKSKTIWKYTVCNASNDNPNTGTIEIPVGSKVIYAGFQLRDLCIWVEVDLDVVIAQTIELRTFHVYGTGHNIPGHATHIWSWQNGPFVFHLYEITEPNASN